MLLKGTNSKKLIVAFSAYQKSPTSMKFDLLNFFDKEYNDYSRHYYLDRHMAFYHKGIEGVSTNIEETVSHLKDKIKDFDEVNFTGISAGGYAAILFGSILKVNKVIAFRPMTMLPSMVPTYPYVDPKYDNLNTYINKTTQYFLYGQRNIDPVDDPLHFWHNAYHCDNINNFANVKLNDKFHMKNLKDKEILKNIFDNHLKN